MKQGTYPDRLEEARKREAFKGIFELFPGPCRPADHYGKPRPHFDRVARRTDAAGRSLPRERAFYPLPCPGFSIPSGHDPCFFISGWANLKNPIRTGKNEIPGQISKSKGRSEAGLYPDRDRADHRRHFPDPVLPGPPPGRRRSRPPRGSALTGTQSKAVIH